jgi:putative RNA 2'-phosphotransferase
MPRTARDLIALSRAVSHALRHEPWLYELEIDHEGWTTTEALLAALRSQRAVWATLCEQDFADMIRLSSKQRYEMAGGRIRALYGHSLPGRLSKLATDPPTLLFHGTSPALEPPIRHRGLLPMRRQYVHLSSDRDTAREVGRRKSAKPIILVVRAADAWTGGIAFYAGNAKVWLADRVPPEFIA